jgi:hypothetical protein
VKAVAIAIAGIALCCIFQFAPIRQSAVAAEPETQAVQPDPNEPRILAVRVWVCANERAWLMQQVDISETGQVSNDTFHQTSGSCMFWPKGALVRIVQTDTVKVVASGPLVLTPECLRLIYPNVPFLTARFGGVPKCFWSDPGATSPFTEKLPDYMTIRLPRSTVPSACKKTMDDPYGTKINKAECEKQSWYEVQIPRRD